MGRKATGGKPGRKSDLEPEQVEFLESYGERFTEKSGNGLYSEVVDQWVEKFGYAGLNSKNKNGIDPSALRLDVDLETLAVDERQKLLDVREAAKQAIRTKLGNWFRHHYHHRKDNRDGIDDVTRSLLDISANRPRKKTELAMYSEMYYESKLKDGFNVMWSGCLRTGIPPKQRIHFVKRFTAENFSKESEEVRAEVTEKCEREYAEALEAWKARMDWSGTPENYEMALSKLDSVLPPFADAISKYTGMVAVVTLVGPSGEDGGEVVVRSTQSVNTKDKVMQTWAQADLQGYRAFQESLIKYGRRFFTESERLSRVINDLEITAHASGSESMVRQPLAIEIGQGPTTALDASPSLLQFVDSPSVNRHDNITTSAEGDVPTSHVNNLGIWEDWQVFAKTLDNQLLPPIHAGPTGASSSSEPYPQLMFDIPPYSDPLFPSNSFVDCSYPENLISNSLGASMTESFNSTAGVTPGTIISPHLTDPTPNGHATDNPNIATTKLSANDVNADPAMAPHHSTTPVTPAAAVHHDTVPAINDKGTSNHDDNTNVPLENSDALNRDGQSPDGVPSVQGPKKRVSARKKTAKAKENRNEGAENVGLKETSLAGRTETSEEGGSNGRSGRKRKATGNAAGEEGSVDGKRSRRKVVLPSHLKETGYTAPKKGSREGKKTK